MEIKERMPDGSYRDSTIRRTYEDPYTLELRELYSLVAEGKEVKTTAADAKKDLEIFGMIMKSGVHGLPASSNSKALNGGNEFGAVNRATGV